MKIDAISSQPLSKELTTALQSSLESGDKAENSGFKHMLETSINQVNDLLQAADKASADVATGRSENLHEAMVAFEKAETAMKFLVQVRNKALDAYHEIMRMQV